MEKNNLFFTPSKIFMGKYIWEILHVSQKFRKRISTLKAFRCSELKKSQYKFAKYLRVFIPKFIYLLKFLFL